MRSRGSSIVAVLSLSVALAGCWDVDRSEPAATGVTDTDTNTSGGAVSGPDGGQAKTHALGGQIAGLAGSVTLVDSAVSSHGAETYTATGNGPFVFPSPVAEGSPYAVSVQVQPLDQTCVVGNGAGTMGTSAISNITVNCTFNSFNVGGTVSGLVSGYASDVVLQLNGGSPIVVASAGTFVFPASLAAGASYSVAVAASPSVPVQNCTVNNGSGTMAAADVTNVAVTCSTPVPWYAYLTDKGGTVGIYAIDAATGAISPAGSQSVSSYPVYGLTLAAENRFLYVAAMRENTIAAFSVDAATGNLTPIAGSPFAADGGWPRTISATPDGRFLHVENQNGDSVSTFAIDAVTGTLSISGTPVASGSQPTSIVTAPNGKFTYVSNATSRDVSAYSIDDDSGALSPVGTYVLPSSAIASSIGIEPRGKFLYASNYSNAIFGFKIDDGAGTLTPVSGSPFATGLAARFIATEPSAKFIYAANPSAQAISAYSIDPTSGALTAISGSPFVNGAAPDGGLTVAPDGKFVYVGSETASTVSVYSRNPATGALTPIPGSPFSTGSLQPTNLIILAQ